MEYKRLGDYIRDVNVRNKDLKVTNPMGINIEKYFMPSVANVIGTDLSAYKLVSNMQFVCNLMHVGRDEKIPMAMHKCEQPIIVSPAYFVFENSKPNELLSDYLMMWFRRPEFDRNAWFYTDADVRGGMAKDALLDMTLPVPSIERQRVIVEEYETLSRRIRLNEQMIEKLEATAQALYRKMFVDGIDRENLPEGWRMGMLEDICDCFDSKRKPVAGYDRDTMDSSKRIYPYYGAAALMDYVDDYIFDGDYILMGEDGTVMNDDYTPVIQYVRGKFWVNNHAHILKGKNGFDENLLYLFLKQTNVKDIVTGGVQAKINQENMMSIPAIIPPHDLIKELRDMEIPIFRDIHLREQENSKLSELQSLLLAKMGNLKQ